MASICALFGVGIAPTPRTWLVTFSFVRGFELFNCGTARTAFEDRLSRGRAESPGVAGPVEQIIGGETLEPGRRAQCDVWKISSPGHPDLSIGLSDTALCRGDIGASLKELRGDRKSVV